MQVTTQLFAKPFTQPALPLHTHLPSRRVATARLAKHLASTCPVMLLILTVRLTPFKPSRCVGRGLHAYVTLCSLRSMESLCKRGSQGRLQRQRQCVTGRHGEYLSWHQTAAFGDQYRSTTPARHCARCSKGHMPLAAT